MTIMPVPGITKSKKKAEPIDVQGRNPNPEYNNAPSVAKEARGIERTELDMPVQADTADLSEPPKVKPEVGKVQVQNTPGGITIVLDDTAGNKRVVIKHPEGGGIEFTPEGGVKLVAMKKKVEVVGSDTTIVVGGDATLEYQGNLNMSVAGEFNVDCLDFNVTTRGNKTETIRGSSNTTIGRGSTHTITGSKTTYVTESVVDTFLNGHEHNVKGDLNQNIQGALGLFASGDIDMTSETDVNIASPNTTLSGDKLSVMGGSGSIGGSAVNFSGKGAVFTNGITATVFTGDLNGKANDACQADYGPSTGTPGTTVDSDTPTFAQIDATKVSAYNNSEFGIKEVLIDDDNEMKNFIDKSSDYEGVHHVRPTTGMARSAMRDTANRNNTKLTNRYIQDGVIDKSFTNPSPPKIGRIVEEEPIPIISSNTTTALNSEMYAINVTKRKFANITPSEDYNPLLKSVIAASTKLNDSVSIAKFLGTEDPTNLNFLRSTTAKQQLAKYLYVHGTTLQSITDNQKDFKGITFKVAEGVYRPGPSETITKDSINDLKLKGRAVVYKAVSVSGKESNSALYDIAVNLKDQAYFKEMQLSYDSLAGRDKITARLVIILPEINDDWDAVFDRKVSTYYNGQKLSEGELVEVLPT